MTWISDLLENEAIFPTRDKAQFPAHFRDICVKIFRRLFRVYAHIYICHIEDIRRLEEEPHLNTSFKHFIFFVQEFQERFMIFRLNSTDQTTLKQKHSINHKKLISKNELAPLQKVIDILVAK